MEKISYTAGIPCKLCHALTVSFTDEATRKLYHHCSRCQFIFLDDAYHLSPAGEKARYALHNNTPENAGYVGMHAAFARQLSSFLKKQVAAALDFGCGPSPVLAELLKKEGLAKTVFIYDKFFFPHFTPETAFFGLITCTEVLEHLDDPLACFTLFQRILKRNGLLALTTHFHTNSRSDFLSWWYKNDTTHISFFSKQTLHWLAGHFNFDVQFINEKNSVVFIKR